jgi:hypothetical protein
MRVSRYLSGETSHNGTYDSFRRIHIDEICDYQEFASSNSFYELSGSYFAGVACMRHGLLYLRRKLSHVEVFARSDVEFGEAVQQILF